MTKLVNRAKMTTATTGTGTITLGSAVDGYQTFANAGVANADVVRYVIEDGDAWEIGLGTYTASGTTLTRGSIESSTGTALNLTGNAVVFVSAAAGDLQELVDFADNFTLPTADGTTGQVLTTNGSGVLTFTSPGASLAGQTDSASPFETSLGFEAGLNTTGVNNTFVGYQAGKANSTGTGNAALGYQAGTALTTGSNNVAIGNGALDAATTGGRNIAIGQDAMGNGVTTNATGDNVAIGFRAGFSLTGGSENVLLGEESGRNLTTAFANIAIGPFALDAATNSGSNNIAIGRNAIGVGVATGGENLAIGTSAGEDLTTAAHSIFLGNNSGANVTTGEYNIAIGQSALGATLTGGRNIAVGPNAMSAGAATATAGYNIALGWQAANNITTGTSNIVAGWLAGSGLTTGAHNIHLGRRAGDTTTTGSNQIVLGYDADASSATVSNEITLGNSSITNLRVPGVGFQFDTTDGLIVPKTITAGGTTGAQTINKTAGSVNFAAAATSLVVTNSFVDANSIIIATVGTNDATMTSVQAVAGAGSFTLYANAAATAETRVNWFVAN
jgi:hypothetical protein